MAPDAERSIDVALDSIYAEHGSNLGTILDATRREYEAFLLAEATRRFDVAKKLHEPDPRNPDEIPLAHLSRQELFSLVCRIGQIVFPHNETLKGELPDVTAKQLLERVAHAHNCGGYFIGYQNRSYEKELGQ